MNENIRDWNPDDGDLCQGDVLLFRLPDGFAPLKTQPVPPRNGKLILAEGELTGHHHAIWFNPPMFRDDALARAMEAAPEPAPAGKVTRCLSNRGQQPVQAALYRDDDLARRLVNDGHLTTADLTIGFLVAEGTSVVLRHQEHDPVRIPPGTYYVGGQQEFHGGRKRRVFD